MSANPESVSFYTSYFSMIARAGIDSAEAVQGAISAIQAINTSTFSYFPEAVAARNNLLVSLRGAYENVFSNAFSLTPMEASFRGLAKYILDTSGRTVDQFLNEHNINVTQTYANISEIFGEAISNENISGVAQPQPADPEPEAPDDPEPDTETVDSNQPYTTEYFEYINNPYLTIEPYLIEPYLIEPYTEFEPPLEPYIDGEKEIFEPYFDNPYHDLDPYLETPYIEPYFDSEDPYINEEDPYVDDSVPETFASSVSQNDITWFFNREYRVGQFVNGDWWVVPRAPNGNVIINSVSPATQDIPDPSYSGLDLRNGTMINPVPASGGNRQGYDERATGYNSGLTAVFPIIVTPSVQPISIVSTISLEEYNESEGSFVDKAQILTVLANIPPENAFRPGYSDINKTIYLQNDDFNSRVNELSSLPPISSTPTLSSIVDKFARPWIDHPIGDGSREIHPIFNMKAYGYEMSKNVGRGGCMLLLDSNIIGDKTQLAINMTQLGIDNYHIINAGGGPFGDGGLGNGRKCPILIAGYFLHDTNMLALSTTYPPASANKFHEDKQTFYITSDDISKTCLIEITIEVTSATNNTVTGTLVAPCPPIPFSGDFGLYGFANLENANDGPGCSIDVISGVGSPTRMKIIESTQIRGTNLVLNDSITLTLTSSWSVIPTAGTIIRVVGYESSEIGIAEWGYDHINLSTWDNPSIPADYRLCCTGGSWHGVQLTMLRLGLKNAWGHDAFFDYVDRYRTYIDISSEEFIDEMWYTYRDLEVALDFTDEPYNEPYIEPYLELTPYDEPYFIEEPYFPDEPYIENIPGTDAYTDTSPDEENLSSSVTQNGFTWTFDQSYPVGQYVNGHWWVRPLIPGGTVTINSVSPAPTTGRNGSMLNPVPASGGNRQAYDDRAGGYNASLAVSYPVVITPSSGIKSLTSTLSLVAGFHPTEGSVVDKAEILTIEDTAPPANSFRPCYAGTTKRRFLLDATFTANVAVLPSLAPTASTPTMASMIALFENPWACDHVIGDASRDVHPISNMKAYGFELTRNVSRGACMLLLNPSSVGDKTELATHMTQLGIDNWGIFENGGGPHGSGGHGGGRMFPVILAGHLLNDEDLLDVATTYPSKLAELNQTFYVAAGDVSATKAIEITLTVTSSTDNTVTADVADGPVVQFTGGQHGLAANSFLANNSIAPGEYIDLIPLIGLTERRQLDSTTQSRDVNYLVGDELVMTVTEDWTINPLVGDTISVVGYEAEHIGLAEWGYNHSDDPGRDQPSIVADYRMCCTGTAWHGFTLFLHQLDLIDVLDHPALPDYVDRYKTVFSPGTGEWVDEMWFAYAP